MLLAGLISEPTSRVARRLDEYIRTAGADCLRRGIFDYFFINFFLENTTNPPNLVATEYFRNLTTWAFPGGGDSVLDILTKRFFSLAYFLSETNALWFYSGLDHSIINFPLLPRFLESLMTRHKSSGEFVFYGQCVFAHGQNYPQGGSGMVVSRFAAQKIIEALPLGALPLNGVDDMAFGHVLNHFGWAPGQMTHPAFLGYHFFPITANLIRSGRFSGLRECSSVGWERPQRDMCRPFVSRLQDIVFFHIDGTQDINAMLSLSEAVFNVPPRVGYYIREFAPRVCLTSETAKAG
jgi:hypothetical protein